jgi:hypothetical protein
VLGTNNKKHQKVTGGQKYFNKYNGRQHPLMAELRTEKKSINKITLQKLKHGKG